MNRTPFRHTMAFATPIILAVAGSACAALPAPSGPDTVSLQTAEDQRLQAEAHHDAAALAQAFADEAVFVHANGKTETKAEIVAAARDHSGPDNAIETSDRIIRVFGDVGVTRGTLTVVIGDMRLAGLYLGVYVWRDERWQLLDWQTSPAPAVKAAG